MQSEALLVTLFASLDSKIYLKPNLGVQNEPCGQNRIVLIFPKECKGTAMQLKNYNMIALV